MTRRSLLAAAVAAPLAGVADAVTRPNKNASRREIGVLFTLDEWDGWVRDEALLTVAESALFEGWAGMGVKELVPADSVYFVYLNFFERMPEEPWGPPPSMVWKAVLRHRPQILSEFLWMGLPEPANANDKASITR